MGKVILSILLAATAVGCASRAAVMEGGGEADSDWGIPWRGQGVQVDTPQQAQDRMPFQMHTPAGPGSLQGIFVAPQPRPPELMGVWFVYDSSQYGTVWIGESLPDISNAQARDAAYNATVSRNGQPGAAQSEVVSIRGGNEALLAVSDAGGVMEWVQNGVQFAIQGPTLTRQQLLDISNNI